MKPNSPMICHQGYIFVWLGENNKLIIQKNVKVVGNFNSL